MVVLVTRNDHACSLPYYFFTHTHNHLPPPPLPPPPLLCSLSSKLALSHNVHSFNQFKKINPRPKHYPARARPARSLACSLEHEDDAGPVDANGHGVRHFEDGDVEDGVEVAA